MKEISRVQNETMGIICQNQVIIINYLQKSCRGLGGRKKKVLNSLADIMWSPWLPEQTSRSVEDFIFFIYFFSHISTHSQHHIYQIIDLLELENCFSFFPFFFFLLIID